MTHTFDVETQLEENHMKLFLKYIHMQQLATNTNLL